MDRTGVWVLARGSGMIKHISLFIVFTLSLCTDITAMQRRSAPHYRANKKTQMHTAPQKTSWPSKQENARQKKLAAMHLERIDVNPSDEVMMVTSVVMLQQLAQRNNLGRR